MGSGGVAVDACERGRCAGEDEEEEEKWEGFEAGLPEEVHAFLGSKMEFAGYV